MSGADRHHFKLKNHYDLSTTPNYLCKACRRQFIETYDPPSPYSDEFKRECLKMHVNGMGFRGIERVKGVHHTTVTTWVKLVNCYPMRMI